MLSSHFGLTQLQTAFAQSWLKRRNVKHGLGFGVRVFDGGFWQTGLLDR